MVAAAAMIRPMPAERVALQPRHASSSDALPASEVRIDGHRTAEPLPGLVLEAAFECQGIGDARFLLFLTDDVPFEDFLHIHLLDASLRLIDSASLGAMYSTGSFRLVGEPAGHVLRFRFFDDDEWSLELLDAAGLRLPFVGEPTGVHRRFGFSRQFRLRAEAPASPGG